VTDFKSLFLNVISSSSAMQDVRAKKGSEEPQERQTESPGLAQAAWITSTGFILFYRFSLFWYLF